MSSRPENPNDASTPSDESTRDADETRPDDDAFARAMRDAMAQRLSHAPMDRLKQRLADAQDAADGAEASGAKSDRDQSDDA